MLNFEISLLKITLDQFRETYLEIKTELGKVSINLVSSISFLFPESRIRIGPKKLPVTA